MSEAKLPEPSAKETAMSEDIERLKSLAAAATPGPWVLNCPDADQHFWARQATVRAPNWGCIATVGIDASMPHWDGPQRANVSLIAACDPATISRLIARLEAAEADARRYRKWRDEYTSAAEQDVDLLTAIGDAWTPGDVDAAIDAAIQGDNDGLA